MSEKGRHLIDHHWRTGRGALFTSLNPATGHVIWEGHAATAQEVDQAVQAARTAFEPWAGRSLSERIGLLEAFCDQLKAHQTTLAEVIAQETGKPLWEALTEVESMLGKVPPSPPARVQVSGALVAVLSAARTAPTPPPGAAVATPAPTPLPAG